MRKRKDDGRETTVMWKQPTVTDREQTTVSIRSRVRPPDLSQLHVVFTLLCAPRGLAAAPSDHPRPSGVAPLALPLIRSVPSHRSPSAAFQRVPSQENSLGCWLRV